MQGGAWDMTARPAGRAAISIPTPLDSRKSGNPWKSVRLHPLQIVLMRCSQLHALVCVSMIAGRQGCHSVCLYVVGVVCWCCVRCCLTPIHCGCWCLLACCVLIPALQFLLCSVGCCIFVVAACSVSIAVPCPHSVCMFRFCLRRGLECWGAEVQDYLLKAKLSKSDSSDHFAIGIWAFWH